MTTNELEKFQQQYIAGKDALEKGNYRLSIQNLERAIELVPMNSKRQGEAKIWLVTAYQAANQIDKAIALSQELIVHPHTQIREQAQRILYIIKAPKLERPKEWMSEIPDLGNADSGTSRYVTAKKQVAKSSAELEYEDLEPSATDTEDNQFVLFAFFLVAVIIGSLVLFG